MAGELVTGPGLVQWGNFLLGRNQALGVSTPYRWQRITGWQDTPALDSGTVARAQQHGAFPGRLLAQSRIITLDGLMVRAAPAQMGTVVGALEAALPLGLDTEQPLVVQLDERGPLLVNARVTRWFLPVSPAWRIGNSAAGAIQWEATDPRRYALAEQSVTTGLPSSESGLAWGTDLTVTRNLVLNPSIELGLTDTQTYGASLTRARVTTDFQTGTACLQHTFTADSTAGSTWTIEPQTGTGTVVRVGIWAKIPASGVSSMQLAWRNGGTTLSTSTVTLPPAGTWTRMTGSYTLTAGQTCDRIGMSVTATNGTVYWLDAAMASTAAALPTYGDGDAAGWWWDGVAHDSTSRTVTAAAGGLSWGSPDTSVGLAWGSPGSTGDVSATNRGTADAHPTITITGPCTTPSVTVGGLVLEYGLTLASTDVLTIDCWAGTVTLGGQDRTASATNRSVPEGSVVIPAGATATCSFRTADVGAVAATCTIRWRSAYW